MDGLVESLWERITGPGRVFIVAEAGVNHNGDPRLARELVDIACSAGADAVKFQSFRVDSLVTPGAKKCSYQLQAACPSETQYDMLKRLELSQGEQQELFSYCRRKGITFMSTPFDEESADFLENAGLEVFKIGSGDLTNLPLIAHIAKKGKPMIVSTGMSTLGEVETALRTVDDAGSGRDGIALLHCVSSYPCSPWEVNLKAMETMRAAFKVPVGYSDHSPGIEIALAAAALGAPIIEKHFTLSKTLSGPDHQTSLDPQELLSLVQSIRLVESALGNGLKSPSGPELATAAAVRRSIVSACDIPAGTAFSEQMIAVKRPGTGMPPSMIPFVLGRKARSDISQGTVLNPEMIA